MELIIATLADRPDLAPVFDRFPDSWPEFMYHDPVSAQLFDLLVARHPESNLIALDRAAPAYPVARACAFPFDWPDDPGHDLPAGGYDHVLLSGATAPRGPRGTLAAALEVTIRPDMRGTGLSRQILTELRHALARLGYTDLVVPVRPNEKHLFPLESMAAYLVRTQQAGLPADPWLRTHIRAGARIVGVAPHSMTVTGTLDEWRSWTGQPFTTSGAVLVPEALVPVFCDVEQGVATYVEPNVWVHHELTH